jgi:hypothetical protein
MLINYCALNKSEMKQNSNIFIMETYIRWILYYNFDVFSDFNILKYIGCCLYEIISFINEIFNNV